MTAKGDMTGIIEAVYFGTVDEEARYRALLAPLVASGELPAFKVFTSESASAKAARQRRAARESAEATAHAKSLGVATDGGPGLAALIQRRHQAGMSSLIASLEARYAPPAKGAKRSASAATAAEPTDAEFDAAQKRLAGRK